MLKLHFLLKTKAWREAEWKSVFPFTVDSSCLGCCRLLMNRNGNVVLTASVFVVSQIKRKCNKRREFCFKSKKTHLYIWLERCSVEIKQILGFDSVNENLCATKSCFSWRRKPTKWFLERGSMLCWRKMNLSLKTKKALGIYKEKSVCFQILEKWAISILKIGKNTEVCSFSDEFLQF